MFVNAGTIPDERSAFRSSVRQVLSTNQEAEAHPERRPVRHNPHTPNGI